MVRTITSREIQAPAGDALGMINAGTVNTTRTWVETSALLVTEICGEPFGRYFLIVVTNDVDEDDWDELERLSQELGKNVAECVVEREHIDSPHPWFPGSQFFDLVTVHGG
ncbi:hypothetical protein OIE82_27195 [Streptomyces althioticus]|uniref:Uncharacterized protein n=1 Tax=Streptomyces althioticus TaxID=83380 RepID=A0ABZ1YAP4_9ACTN